MPEVFNGPEPPAIPTDVLTCAYCSRRDEGVTQYNYHYHGHGENPVHLCTRCVRGSTFLTCTSCEGRFLVGRRRMPVELGRWPAIKTQCMECATQHMATTPPLEVHQCFRCGNIHSDHEEVYCAPCRQRYKLCSKCGEQHYDISRAVSLELIVDKKGTKETVHSQTMCWDCVSADISHCHGCGGYFRDASGEKQLCPVCTVKSFNCDLCGVNSLKKFKRMGMSVCSHCVEYRFSECEQCGEEALDAGARYHHHHASRRDRFCGKCIGSPVLDYKYKREPKFFGTGPLFYGIENEYDWDTPDWQDLTDVIRAWVWERKDRYHIVHDGSLKRGVEIVSQPGSFDFWMSQRDLVPDVPNKIEMGTQGCHVHISKNAFTGFHLFKFLNFMTNNFDNLVGLFGRGIGNYRENVGQSLVRFAKEQTNPSKYWWINMQSGKTVELRIFVGAQTNQDIRENLQLLDAVYYYSLTRKPADMLDWREFYRFVNSMPQYVDLLEAIDKKPKPQRYEAPNIVPLSEEEMKEVATEELEIINVEGRPTLNRRQRIPRPMPQRNPFNIHDEATINIEPPPRWTTTGTGG